MNRDDKESSGMVCAVARRTGAAAGTSVVVGKWIAGAGGKTVNVATDWIKGPFRVIRRAKNGKGATVSGNGEPTPEQETTRKMAAKALIAAAESATVTTENELKIAENMAEKSIAKAKSDASAMKDKYDKEIAAVKARADESIAKAEAAAQQAIAEAESKAEATAKRCDKELAAVRAEVDQAVTKAESAADESVLELTLKVEGAEAAVSEQSAELAVEPEAVTHEERIELADEPEAAACEESAELVEVAEAMVPKEVDELLDAAEGIVPEESAEPAAEQTSEEQSDGAPDAEMPSLVKVTEGEARAAVFADPADRLLFMEAFREIASQDPTVRADAAKTLADVPHDVSVRVLVSQMASEPSARVRRECDRPSSGNQEPARNPAES